tara:strand:- start:2324 stop:2590 length:267 start_codon:yes stop_codon:yes gene_type:complete
MSIIRCERCDTPRDTDWVVDCEDCAEDLQNEFNKSCSELDFSNALSVSAEAYKFEIDIDNTDDDYKGWLSNEDWKLSQCERGGQRKDE